MSIQLCIYARKSCGRQGCDRPSLPSRLSWCRPCCLSAQEGAATAAAAHRPRALVAALLVAGCRTSGSARSYRFAATAAFRSLHKSRSQPIARQSAVFRFRHFRPHTAWTMNACDNLRNSGTENPRGRRGGGRGNGKGEGTGGQEQPERGRRDPGSKERPQALSRARSAEG